MKMTLTHDAKHWHRLWSVRLGVAAAVFAALEATLPLWEAAVPHGVFATLAALSGAGVGVVRVLKQSLPALPETSRPEH